MTGGAAQVAAFGRAIVVGAAGGMGRMFLERLEASGCPTLGVDLRGDGRVTAEDVLAPSPEFRAALAGAGLVILAVPDEVACRAGAGIAAAMDCAAVLADCTSVKAPYVSAVGQAGACGLISVNPLFGPGLDWTGRTVVVTEIRAAQHPGRLERFLEGAGLRIVRLDADSHDRLAAEAQAQVHAAVLAFILSASPEGMVFDTPPNRVMRMLAARILSGEAHVYRKIQTSNPFAGPARARLAEALRRLDAACAADDPAAFAGLLDEARARLGPEAGDLAARCARLFATLP